ncbi:GNAT family N-acetyltransferase [Aquihabitans daechungensis]|uniref:GNAT family N-acetyltransferase n=1 Tax=Aquihabitans daechungensis TaxID=1052257 RepID=UPI003B9FE984
MPDVRPATPADLPAIGRTLAAAFDGDPVWSHLASPKADWTARASAWFAAEARSQLKGHGEVLVDDEVRGAAIWVEPRHWKGTLDEGLALAVPSLRLFRSRMPRAMSNLTLMERKHPEEPDHWYLAILGTDPAHQGAGIGSALIRAVTDRCDQQGLGAYLESSKEQNVPYYARHGFEVREQITSGDGPPMWLMWRDPKG